MMRLIYSVVLWLLAPGVLLRLWWRGRRAPAYRRRWGERFGAVVPLSGPAPVWVHAVSVGETQAAAPLIQALMREYPDVPVWVTSTTPTGSDRVRALFGDSVYHSYAPYDLPGAVERFLDRVRPRLALIMETELWPNLFHACRRRGIAVVVANARLSPRSAAGYRRVRPLVAATLGNVEVIAAQTREDAERFAALGARADQLRVMGNIKFDIAVPVDIKCRGEQLRREQFGGRPVWVAASTHAGEDEQVLDAYAGLRQRVAGVLLVLVPRHPERFDAVVELCRERGYDVARRSEGKGGLAGADVLVGDTMGELPVFYAACDVAFVGGSLVPVGGHNVLEAAALGVPVVFGPHMFNFDAIARLFVDAGAARQVAGSGELAEVVSGWFDAPEVGRGVGRRGFELVEANRGALDRLLALCRGYLRDNLL